MTTGTLSASDIAKCSFDIPISPAALAPTIRKTHDGAPEVSPYNVVYTTLVEVDREEVSQPSGISHAPQDLERGKFPLD
jgi:hypothetical protein